MCTGSAGLSIANGPGIEHDDAFVLSRQQICRRQPRDPGADDADIRLSIFGEGIVFGRIDTVRPQGNRLSIGAFHGLGVTRWKRGANEEIANECNSYSSDLLPAASPVQLEQLLYVCRLRCIPMRSEPGL